MSDKSTITIDWAAAAKSVGDVVVAQISSLAELAKDDVAVGGMAREVTQYILEGVRTGDEEMVRQAKAVVPVLLETYRIKAAQATNAAIEAAIGTAADLAFGLLGQFIPKVAPPAGG